MNRWYRVAPVVPSAVPGQPGHPLFVWRAGQGAGRADNPAHYTALYLARQAQGAVGEALGDAAVWSSAMLKPTRMPSARSCLITIDMDPGTRLLDLDDPATLAEWGLRPTDVVGRNRERTREVALRLFLERRWDGLLWWSYWRPEWQVAVLWCASPESHGFQTKARVVKVEPLTLAHPAMRTAADVLRRLIA